jgi:hypothetical protein
MGATFPKNEQADAENKFQRCAPSSALVNKACAASWVLNFRLLSVCAHTDLRFHVWLLCLPVCVFGVRRNFRLIVFRLAPRDCRRHRLRWQPWAQMKPSKRALTSRFIGPARQRICSIIVYSGP